MKYMREPRAGNNVEHTYNFTLENKKYYNNVIVRETEDLSVIIITKMKKKILYYCRVK